MYLLSPISSWHVTRLAHHSVRLHEWTAKPSPFSIQGSLWEFSEIKAANTEKSVSLTDSDVKTFLEGKENQYSKRKTKMYVLSGFNNSISRGCHRPMWLFTWKIISVVEMNENFVNWKLWLFLLSWFNAFFLSANPLCNFYWGIVHSFIFNHE